MDYYKKRINILVKKAQIFDAIFGRGDDDDDSSDAPDTTAPPAIERPGASIGVNSYSLSTKYEEISKEPRDEIFKKSYISLFSELKNISSDNKKLKTTVFEGMREENAETN